MSEETITKTTTADTDLFNKSKVIVFLKEVPAHVWLFAAMIIMFVGYYIRPDNLTTDLIKSIVGAWLLCLRAEVKSNSQPPQV